MASNVTLVLVLFLTAILGWLYYWRCRYWASRLPKNVMRCGRAYPLVGNLYQMFIAPDGLLEKGLGHARRLGIDKTLDQVIVWMGEKPAVMTFRAEHLEILLANPKPVFKPDLIYGPIRSFLGDGLITLNGETWRHHRKVLTPVFHFNTLEKYADVFERRAGVLVKELLDPKYRGVETDAFPHMCRCVSHTICETAFGIGEQTVERDEIRKRDAFLAATEVAFKIVEKRVMKPWYMIEWMFRLSPLYKVQIEAERAITDYALEIIKMKKEEIASNGDSKIADDETGVKKKVSFLELVLQGASNLLTEEEILQEVRTLVAVQQTTSTALAFIFVMLAIHQDVQEQVYREVVEHEELAKGRTVYERLGELKYLERVIKETLRLYPVTAIFSRELKEDLVFPEYVLPAGASVIAFVYLTHRDPRFYGADPGKFDPDHFLPERCRSRHPYAYVPFSAGPRNCIGQKYAMLQMKAIVSSVVSILRIFPGKDCHSQKELDLDMDTFLHIKKGFNVRFEPRD